MTRSGIRKTNRSNDYKEVIAYSFDQKGQQEWAGLVKFYGREKVVNALKNEINVLSYRAVDNACRYFGLKKEDLLSSILEKVRESIGSTGVKAIVYSNIRQKNEIERVMASMLLKEKNKAALSNKNPVGQGSEQNIPLHKIKAEKRTTGNSRIKKGR